MGEARKRGTYEQRRDQAIELQNNEMIEKTWALKHELRRPSKKAATLLAIAAAMSFDIRNN